MNAEYIIEHYFKGEKTVKDIKRFFDENKFKLSDADAEKLYQKYFKPIEHMKIDITSLYLKAAPNFKKGEFYAMSVTGKVGIAKKIGYVLKSGYKPTEWERFCMDGEYFDIYNGPQALVKSANLEPASLVYLWENIARKEELPPMVPFSFLISNMPKHACEWNYSPKKPAEPNIPKYVLFFCCPLWKLEEIIDFENRYQEEPWIVKIDNNNVGRILKENDININLYNRVQSQNIKTFQTKSAALKYLLREVDWAVDEFTTQIEDVNKRLRNAKIRVANETKEMVSVNKGMKLGVKYTAHSSKLDYDFIPQTVDEHGFYRTEDGIIINEGIQANTAVENNRLLRAYGKVMSYIYIANTNIVDRHIKKVNELIADFDNLDEVQKQNLVRYVKICIETSKKL